MLFVCEDIGTWIGGFPAVTNDTHSCNRRVIPDSPVQISNLVILVWEMLRAQVNETNIEIVHWNVCITFNL